MYNYFVKVSGSAGHQGINVSRMATDAAVDMKDNTVSCVDGGIHVTTWLAGGETAPDTAEYKGTVSIVANELSCINSANMVSIFVGYDLAAADAEQAHGVFSGELTSGSNANNVRW